MATSICADETNNTTDLYDIVPSVFKLGGLGGFPHAGVTGLNAFFLTCPTMAQR
ncbi:MAG: hypothetical protein HC896_10085 [Bacteroidales bacterium]|nr:hypothetical protein [Bacteroidales bacterium]